MQTKPVPTEGRNSTKLEAKSALRDAACSPLLFIVKDGETPEKKALKVIAHWARNGMEGPIMLSNSAPSVEVGMVLKSLGIDFLRIDIKVSGLDVLAADESYSVVDVSNNPDLLACLGVEDRVTDGNPSEWSIGSQDHNWMFVRKLHPVMVAALQLEGVEVVIRLHSGRVGLDFFQENVQGEARADSASPPQDQPL